jgi:hypothetical protein
MYIKVQSLSIISVYTNKSYIVFIVIQHILIAYSIPILQTTHHNLPHASLTTALTTVGYAVLPFGTLNTRPRVAIVVICDINVVSSPMATPIRVVFDVDLIVDADVCIAAHCGGAKLD